MGLTLGETIYIATDETEPGFFAAFEKDYKAKRRMDLVLDVCV